MVDEKLDTYEEEQFRPLRRNTTPHLFHEEPAETHEQSDVKKNVLVTIDCVDKELFNMRATGWLNCVLEGRASWRRLSNVIVNLFARTA